MDLQDNTKFEPGRPLFVLLHKDRTHIQSLPNGEPDWSYNKADMELRQKILQKDFHNNNYEVVTADIALTHIANRQAELIIMWTPVINAIRKEPNLAYKRNLYTRFAKRTKLPHPVEADGLLKKELRW
tara:strand:+ start:7867 stop:8250 length:384 start_codon:yes stop_codon:yes gene_type:complete